MNLPGIFSIGFVPRLTGAMAPGPLLTVTIGQSARKGGIAGPMVVLGHGVLEFAPPDIIHDKELFHKELADYLIVCTTKRIHKGLGNQTPVHYLIQEGVLSQVCLAYAAG